MLCRSHGIAVVNQNQFNQPSNAPFNNYPQMNNNNNKFGDQQQQQQQQQHHHFNNNLEQQSAQINSTTSPNHVSNLMLSSNEINCSTRNQQQQQNAYNFNKIYANSPNNDSTILHHNSNNMNVSQIISDTISGSMCLLDTGEMFKENLLLSSKIFNDTDIDHNIHNHTHQETKSNEYVGKTVKECISLASGELVSNAGASGNAAKKTKYVRKRDLQAADPTNVQSIATKRFKKEPKIDKEIKVPKDEPISPSQSQPLADNTEQKQQNEPTEPLIRESCVETRPRTPPAESQSESTLPTGQTPEKSLQNDNTNGSELNPNPNETMPNIAQQQKTLSNTGTLNAANLKQLQATGPASKYIITKTPNRINPLMVTNKVNLNADSSNASLASSSSSSVTSAVSVSTITPTIALTTPSSIVKLMTSHSKDPTLSSSQFITNTSTNLTSLSVSSSSSAPSLQRAASSSECQSC